jgi:hypothetical protein
MTGTIQDIQRHTTMKIGQEVEELYQYVRDTKQLLAQTIKVTRRKPIPIRQHSRLTTTTTTTPTAALTSQATKATTTISSNKRTTTKKTKSVDKSNSDNKSTKETCTMIRPVKTTALITEATAATAIATNNCIPIDTKPDPDPAVGFPPLCDARLPIPAPLEAEFIESFVPNEILKTDPHLHFECDDTREIYEI